MFNTRRQSLQLWAVSVILCLGVICLPLARAQNCTEEGCSNFSTVGVCEPVSGECTCNRTNSPTSPLVCFNLVRNFCELDRCYRYDNETELCREGIRSRKTALLLSIFLINFGAANFYIRRFELAVPQIILGLLLCFFQIGSCAVAGTKDEDTSTACIICCSFNTVFSLLFLAWWIADLVIFATNQRLDGDDCVLS